jgi:hypothetical protein
MHLVYRATYGQTRAEIQISHGAHDTGKVVVGVIIGVASGLLLGKTLQATLSQPAPKTLSPEWKAAEAKQLKERGINPVTGYGSK